MDIVVKFGGSLLFDNGNIDTQRVDAACGVIRGLYDSGHNIGIVVGGGYAARMYIKGLGTDSFPEASKDNVAVMATRLNAMLFISRLADICYPYPPTSYTALVKSLATGKIVVCGGMQPGQSTNAVATLVCEAMGAKTLINATNVDYIYDKDPQKHPDATPYKCLTYMELKDIIASCGAGAGQYEMFDLVAANNIERSSITLHFVDGKDPENISRVLSGCDVGTVVNP